MDDLAPDTLRELCAQLQLGQRAAARLAHIDEGLFRRMCRGRCPITPDVIMRLRELVEARAGRTRTTTGR